jgi:tetratricopeptide (TPR) repeat protein
VYPEYLVLHPEDAYRRMSYAVTLAINGERDKAINEGEKALELSPNDPIMMYYGANLYSRLMEKDKAVELIPAAVKNGYENFEWIKRDPDFDNIRKEPGFLKLIQGK